MEDFYLNLNSRTRIADFLSEWLGYGSKDIKTKADSTLTAYDDGKDLDVVEMADVARDLAIDIWPTRFALNRFFSEEGGMIEWDMVEKAVTRSTAHLMERFRKTSGVKSLDELFEHDDFDISFKDAEKSEIEQVRIHVREDYWKQHAENLVKLVEEGRIILEKFLQEMGKMRKIAEGLPTMLQDELYSKISRFEDRVLFYGEHIPLEMLNEELAYYTEQKELPIEQ